MSLSERWIEGMNAISSPWAETMLRACWQGGLALLAAWGICGLLARRWGGAGRAQCWFWRMGYGKFLVCIACVAPLSLPLLPAPVQPSTAKTIEAGAAVPLAMAEPVISGAHAETPIVAANDTRLGTMEGFPAKATPAEVPAMVSVQAGRRLSGESWLLLTWMCGVAIFGVRLGIACWRTRALSRSAAPLQDRRVLEAYGHVAARMNISRHVPVHSSEEVASPLLICLRRPAIVLPMDLAAGCGRDQLELIFAHELAHLRRRDLLWNWLQAAVQALFFFHPLTWLTRRPWMLAQELACDEMALAATGARPADYGRVLLTVITHQKIDRPRLVGASVAESGGSVRRRLLAMKNGLGWSRRRVMVTAMAAGVAGVIGLVPWRLAAQQAPTSAAPRVTAPPLPTAAAPGESRPIFSSATNVDPPLPAGSADDIARRMSARRAAQAGNTNGTTITASAVPLVDKRNTPVVTGADPRKIEVSDKWITQIIPLRYADAVRMRNDLTPMFSVDASVTTNASSNSIVITDTSAHVRQIVEIIASLDTQAEVRGASPPVRAGTEPAAGAAVPGPANPGEMTFRAQLSAPIDEIRARVEGSIMEINVKDGQAVKKGDVLFRLDSREAEMAVQVAKARLSSAKVQYDHLSEAAKMGTVPIPEANQAEANLIIVQAELEQKAVELSLLTLKAPSDGIVMLGDVTPERFVTKGSALAKVVNVGELTVNAFVPQNQSGNIQVGQKLVFVSNGAECPGEITFISPIVDSATGTLLIRGRLTGDRANLKSGSIGTVTLVGNR